MIDRWLRSRSLARINEWIAPATCSDAVAVQARSAGAYLASITGGASGLLAGWALDAPSGVGDGMWPVGAIALSAICAVFGLIGMSRNYLFIQTDRSVLFTTASRFRASPIDVVAELNPPLEYRMRRRIMFYKISWDDRTLWMARVDADRLAAIAGTGPVTDRDS